MGHDFCNKLFFITRGKFDTFVIWPIVHQSWSYLPTLLVDSLITLPFSGGLNPINKYDHLVHLYPKKTQAMTIFFEQLYTHILYTCFLIISLSKYCCIYIYIYSLSYLDVSPLDVTVHSCFLRLNVHRSEFCEDRGHRLFGLLLRGPTLPGDASGGIPEDFHGMTSVRWSPKRTPRPMVIPHLPGEGC